MNGSSELALVEVGGLFLFYFRRDHAFSYALRDSRAREVSAREAQIRWRAGEVDPEQAWGMRGMGLFSLASIHYWRHHIDFDYLDVGANVGLTAIGQGVFYKRCGRSNRTYAFEPGDVFPLLETAVELNGLRDTTTCVRVAVTDHSGKAEFHLTPAQSPAGSLLHEAVIRPGIVETRPITVNLITIDDFVDQIRPGGGLLVKIDAEGADPKVIDGMARVLSDRICTLQIEFFPELIDSYANPEEKLRQLTEQFELIDVGKSPHIYIEQNAGSIAEFVERVRKLAMPATDIFMVPKNLPDAAELVSRIILG